MNPAVKLPAPPSLQPSEHALRVADCKECGAPIYRHVITGSGRCSALCVSCDRKMQSELCSEGFQRLHRHLPGEVTLVMSLSPEGSCGDRAN